MADYSKDIELMEKLNHTYGEFELINDKINFYDWAHMANIEKSNIDKSNELKTVESQQLEGAINLGENVLPVIDECLDILNKTIKNKTSNKSL